MDHPTHRLCLPLLQDLSPAPMDLAPKDISVYCTLTKCTQSIVCIRTFYCLLTLPVAPDMERHTVEYSKCIDNWTTLLSDRQKTKPTIRTNEPIDHFSLRHVAFSYLLI